MFWSISRFQLDRVSFCDHHDRLDMVLSRVVKEASLEQVPTQLPGADNLPVQRIEVDQLG